MAHLIHAEADYTDHYIVDAVVPQVNDHAPVRVTRGAVRIEHTSANPSNREVRVTLRVTGEPVVQTNGRYQPIGGSDVTVFGLGQEQQRYELCAAMVQDALERHHINESDVAGFAFLEPWETYTATHNWGAVNLAGSPSKFVVGGDERDDIEDDRW